MLAKECLGMAVSADLEGEIAPLADDLGADLDQFLP
jgi:hypothetical protein